MAYQGSGRVQGNMYASFNDQTLADAFRSAAGSTNFQAGQYFTGSGGTQYKTVSGIDPNKPGWGSMIEPGYQLIGYQKPQTNRGRETSSGFAILQKQPAPAPPPPPPAPAAPPPPPAPSQLQIQYDTYRQQAEKSLAEAQAKAARLESEEYQQKQAAELQNRLAIQSQASKERGAAAATLKIAPDSQTSQTAGTSAFKRRRDQTTLAPIQTTAGINAPARSVLNV